MKRASLVVGCAAAILVACAAGPTPTATKQPTPTPQPTATPEPVEECYDHLSAEPLLGSSGHSAGGVLLSQFAAPEGGWRITRVGFYVLEGFRPIEAVLYDEDQTLLLRILGGAPSEEGWFYVAIPETAPVVRGTFYAGLVYIAPLVGRDDQAQGGHSWFIDPNGVWGRWGDRAPEFALPSNGEWAIQVCALAVAPVSDS